MKRLLIILFPFLLACAANAQEEVLIQVSGLVMTSDTAVPVSWASIHVSKTSRGTIANGEGFFSIVLKQGEVIEVTAVGFKPKAFYLPENLTENKYNAIILMEEDTFEYGEITVYPWPTREKFKQAFLALEIQKDATEIARDNLSQENLLKIMNDLSPDGYESQSIQLTGFMNNARYMGGQTNYAIFPGSNMPVPLSLLNPMAWASLIKAIKEGKFRRTE